MERTIKKKLLYRKLKRSINNDSKDTYIHTYITYTSSVRFTSKLHAPLMSFYTWVAGLTIYKLLMINFYLRSELLPKIYWGVVAKERLFHVLFCSKCVTCGLTSDKPTHYLLDYGVLLACLIRQYNLLVRTTI